MDDNRRTLDNLFAKQQISLEHSAFFDSIPPPQPENLDWARVNGMMLGLAIGDALGNTTEGQTPGKRQRSYGEIRDYLPNCYADNQPVGVPSDDTQLAFWTLEQLFADGRLDPDHLAARFCAEDIFGLGGAVKEFISNYKRGKRPWYRCAARSAGNGALMRIAPVLIPHLRHGTPSLWADVALAALVTHNDATSTSACLAWTYTLWSLLGMDKPADPLWWPETYVAIARELEGETGIRPRGGAYPGYQGPLWRFVAEHVPEAYRQGLSVRDACDHWYSGAFLLETVCSVLYILMRCGHDPEQALVRAVNDTKDNDTIAAIVGSAVGALYGQDRLPARWLRGLTGRTAAGDDGHILALLSEARQAFGPQPCPL